MIVVNNEAKELFLKKCKCYNCRYVSELEGIYMANKFYICPKCENHICENCHAMSSNGCCGVEILELFQLYDTEKSKEKLKTKKVVTVGSARDINVPE